MTSLITGSREQPVSKKKYRSTLERASKKDRPGFRLTQRDLEIIKTVYLYRVMTTEQIRDLIFPGGTIGKRNTCRNRLQKLWQHEYLWRGEQPTILSEGRKPLVYRINKKALDLLPQLLGLEREEIDWKPSERNLSEIGLNHLLKTNDVRVAFEAGAEANGKRIKQWIDERNLRRNHANEKVIISDVQGQKKSAAIIPDGYLNLYDKQIKKSSHFFFEIDLQTETGMSSNPRYRDWVRKVRTYLAYYNSDLYKNRYKSIKFRVLTVTTSLQRLKNLKQKTEATGAQRIFWFTTFDQLTPDTVYTDPIWQVASLDKPLNLKK